MQGLSDYECGRCAAAIEAVGRRDKPIAEVCETSVPVSEIIKSLGELLLNYHQGNVDAPIDIHAFIYTLTADRFIYGFFREPWTLRAYSIVRGNWELTYQDPEWIQGLLFGYTPQAIQRFIDAATTAGWFTESLEPKSTLPQIHVLSMEENAHLCSEQSRKRSIRVSHIFPTAHMSLQY